MKKLKPSIQILLIMSIFTILGCSSNKPLPTVNHVDLELYKGTWYEIARFPNSFEKGLDCTTATYSLRDDGKIDVVNKGRKVAKNNKTSEAKGVAWVPNPKIPGQLKVRFFWPFSGDYYIMELDKNYQHVLVGSPNRKYLWVLARTKTLNKETYQNLLKTAEKQGFDTSLLELINQECN